MQKTYVSSVQTGVYDINMRLFSTPILHEWIRAADVTVCWHFYCCFKPTTVFAAKHSGNGKNELIWICMYYICIHSYTFNYTRTIPQIINNTPKNIFSLTHMRHEMGCCCNSAVLSLICSKLLICHPDPEEPYIKSLI